jgi:hypothetical protein
VDVGDPSVTLDDFTGGLGLGSYTTDFIAAGVEPGGTPVERYKDCNFTGAGDTTWNQSTFPNPDVNNSTNVNTDALSCTYTAAGQYIILIRNVRENCTASDPENPQNPGYNDFNDDCRSDASATVVIFDRPPSAYILEDDGLASTVTPTPTLNDLTGQVPPNYQVDLRAYGVDDDVHQDNPPVNTNRGVTSTWAVTPAGSCTSPGDTTTCTFTDANVSGTAQFTITLTNTDGTGNTATATVQVMMMDLPPSAYILENDNPPDAGDPSPSLDDLTGVSNYNVNLDCRGVDPENGPVTCTWSTTGVGASCTSPGAITTCTYPNPGQETVTLTVTDSDGDSTTASLQVTMFEWDPDANIRERDSDGPGPDVSDDPTDLVGTPPFTATFTSQASDIDNGGAITTREWDCIVSPPVTTNFTSDGTGINFDCTYTAPGVYIAALRVTDDEGSQAMSTTQVVVLGSLRPTADINENTGGGTLAKAQNLNDVFLAPGPMFITLAAIGVDPDGGAVTYDWDCDNPGGNPGTFGVNGSGASFTCSYTTTGVYGPWLRVTDDENQVSYSAYVVVIYNIPPTLTVKSNGPNCLAIGPTINATDLVNGFNGFGPFPNPPYENFCLYAEPTTSGDPDGKGIEVWFDLDNNGTWETQSLPPTGNLVPFTHTLGQFTVPVCILDESDNNYNAGTGCDGTGSESTARLTLEANETDGATYAFDKHPSPPYADALATNQTTGITAPFNIGIPGINLYGTTPATFNFYGFADDPDDGTLGLNDPAEISWCWETSDNLNPAGCDSTAQNPSFTFGTNGLKNIYLKVCDNEVQDANAIPGGPFASCAALFNAWLALPPSHLNSDASLDLYVVEGRCAAAFHKVDPSYGWPDPIVDGFQVHFVGASECAAFQNIGWHYSFGDGGFQDNDAPPTTAFPFVEVHDGWFMTIHSYMSPGQFYALLTVEDEDTFAKSKATVTITGTDWPLFP